MIDVLSATYPVRVLCDLLDCARSSYYHQPRPGDDDALKAALTDVAAEWPTYGYRRLTVQVRRDKKIIANSKRVRRLMKLMQLGQKHKRKKRRTTNSQHPFPRYPNLVQDLEVVRPDQVWVVDLTYVRLKTEFVYLAVIMDVFTRGMRGWHLWRSLDHTLTLTAFRRALAQYPAPEIHHSDRAPVSPFIFSGGDTPFPAEGGTAQRLTQRSKDQWGQSVTW